MSECIALYHSKIATEVGTTPNSRLVYSGPNYAFQSFLQFRAQFEHNQSTQNICITFVQCWTDVEDVGPTLYKINAIQMFCSWDLVNHCFTSLFVTKCLLTV